MDDAIDDDRPAETHSRVGKTSKPRILKKFRYHLADHPYVCRMLRKKHPGIKITGNALGMATLFSNVVVDHIIRDQKDMNAAGHRKQFVADGLRRYILTTVCNKELKAKVEEKFETTLERHAVLQKEWKASRPAKPRRKPAAKKSKEV